MPAHNTGNNSYSFGGCLESESLGKETDSERATPQPFRIKTARDSIGLMPSPVGEGLARDAAEPIANELAQWQGWAAIEARTAVDLHMEVGGVNDGPPSIPDDPYFELSVTTLFVTHLSPVALGNAMLGLLREFSACHVRVNRQKFRLKADVIHEAAGCCTVKICVYELPQGIIAVEFRRYAGCSVTFNNIFQRAEEMILNIPTTHFAAPPILYMETDLDGMQPLLDMASWTDNPMTQKEAAQALGGLAADPRVARYLCTEPAFKHVAKLLRKDRKPDIETMRLVERLLRWLDAE